jgi:glycosyltransferase involved in cell wall biosynthesis
MAKILILSNNDIGLYKFRKELIKKLIKDHEVYISLPNGDLVPALVDMGCVYLETKMNRRGKNPFSDINLFFSYLNILNKIQPDFVLTYTIKPNIYGGLACLFTNNRYIANITGLGTAVENEGILQKITTSLYKLSLSKANCVFFQNKHNKEFFRSKKIYKGNSKLIPGSGVNLKEYSYSKYPSEDKVRFLFVARVMKEKGIEQFLGAAKYIKKRYANTEFHIVGFCEEDYKEELNKLTTNGTIFYHGMQEDVLSYYASSHCIVHPTFYPEGMSNVLLEGAAVGRPVITTNRPGCKEIVLEDKTGFVVKENNTKDLIKKIEQFLSLEHNEKESMGKCGREKVAKEFDRSIVVNQYLAEIN